MSTRMKPVSGVGHGRLEAGGTGGGGGWFAPSPGYAPPRPPGAPPRVSPAPPMGAPKNIFPPRKRGTWQPSRGMKKELEKKASGFFNFLAWAVGDLGIEDFMQPDSPVQSPPGKWQPGGTWIRCPSPTQACEDTWSPPTVYRFLSTNGASCTTHSACATNQSYDPVSARAAGSPVPNGWNRIRFYTKTAEADPFGNEKGTIMAQYRRTVAGEVPSPWVPGRIVLPEQFEDPFAEPAMQPMEKTYAKTRTRTAPGYKPWYQPAIEFNPDVNGGLGVPTVHKPEPPLPPDREQKHKMDYGITGKIYGELTEFRDMMDCFASASGMKPPKGPIGDRARKIYDHLNASNPDGSPKNPIDTMAFAKCMALANAKDFAIGKLSNETAKNLNKSPYVAPRPGGYRGGGWSTRMS